MVWQPDVRLFLGGTSGIIETRSYDLARIPCPTIMANGMGGVNNSLTQCWLEGNLEEMTTNGSKPPYRVPTMYEVEQIPWNGFNVISTFSGAGGSCLGFRMAGFKTLWASEFIESAREVYELNHPGVPVDGRDIRDVSVRDVLQAAGLKEGECDVMEGSPPCASFSTAGRREQTWGEIKSYSETEQRVDDLFWEFARLVEGVKPRFFVAENVSGLVKGKAKGYFKLILRRLRRAGYVVCAKLLDAQWLGVPQMRQRIIFVGAREDLSVEPRHPPPLAFRYSVAEALPCVARVSRVKYVHPSEGRHTFHDAEESPAPTVKQSIGGDTEWSSKALVEVYADGDTGEDVSLGNAAIGEEWDKIRQGSHSKKYFQLGKPDPGGPSYTVTQVGGSVAAAAVTHPVERRKFYISELKRICAFPDDFALTGSYAQQWERLGRAVPPVMMWHVARTVRKQLFELDGREPWTADPPSLLETLRWRPDAEG